MKTVEHSTFVFTTLQFHRYFQKTFQNLIIFLKLILNSDFGI